MNRGSNWEYDPDRPTVHPQAELTATYDYRDDSDHPTYHKKKYKNPDGTKAYRLYQYNPLSFSDRLNPEDKWHERAGRGDHGPMLYRLPELRQEMADQPEASIFVCEGEKDADNLRSHGLIATTGSDGALGWNDAFGRFFIGRNVVIVVDNDENGRRGAAKVRAGLRGVAATIKIIEFTDLPENGDVSDFIEERGFEAFIAHVIGTPENNEPLWARSHADAMEFDRLSKLSRVDYDRERKLAAKALGVSSRTLDKEVEKRRAASGPSDVEQGTALVFKEIHPNPDAVDGPELIKDLIEFLQRHVVFPADDHALAVALWAIHAHALAKAEHSPRLHITAPTKGCGKTVLLTAIAALVPRPLRTEHISQAALFRVMEKFRPTLLIDEADTFLKDNEELRCLLNAGYEPDGCVTRCVGDKHEARSFSVWGAIAMAGIGALHGTIEDRSIIIPLRRRLPTDEKVERLRRSKQDLSSLAARIARWTADNLDRLAEDPEMPDDLGDRPQDCWRLLIAIADAMSVEIGEAARKAARALNRERDHDDNDAALMALSDVHGLFDAGALPSLSSAYLVEKLAGMEDRPWSSWRRGQPLTQSGLARLLTPFGIKPKQIKAHKGKGYERAPVAEAYKRYCAAKAEEEIEADDPI